MTRKIGFSDRVYQAYLDVQRRRTLTKRSAPLQERTKLMVDKLDELHLLSSARALCIGCRNALELDYFESRGVAQVVGIDRFSEDPRILVMDMHQMDFPDDTSDIIFSCHSLEHSIDVTRAAAEFMRVVKHGGVIAIEVPVQYTTRGADLVDFGTLTNLHRFFRPRIERVLWTDRQAPYSARNRGGNHVIRTVIAIDKG